MFFRGKKPNNDKATVLAIASAGGHWQQLMQIVEAFNDANLVLASTNPDLGKIYGFENVVYLSDYNKDNLPKVLAGLWQTFRIVRKIRPDLVVSTGAAPGLLCLFWAHVAGARTIWIDSIANSQKLSLSGQLATRFADVVLTQWQHLTNDGRSQYKGAVL